MTKITNNIHGSGTVINTIFPIPFTPFRIMTYIMIQMATRPKTTGRRIFPSISGAAVLPKKSDRKKFAASAPHRRSRE